MLIALMPQISMKQQKQARNRIRRISLVVVMLLSMSSSARAAEKISLGVHFSNQQDVLGKWIDLIYTEAFRRIGMEMEYKELPYKRGDAMVDAGEIDGVLARPKNYGDLHPSLIRVEEAAPIDSLGAFATEAGLQLQGWESLKGMAGVIEYPRGFVLAEINLPKLVTPEQISPSDNLVQSLKKLAAGRIHLLLAPASILGQLLRSEEFANSGIRNVGAMQDVELFAYLQSKHAEMAVKLAEALRAMKTEGLFEQYRATAEEATKKAQ